MVDGHVLVMGSGDRALREYALAAMSSRAPLALLNYRRPTWEKAYVNTYACVDLQDPAHIIARAGSLDPIGITTYDERLTENTAAVAAALGLRGPSVDAIAGCKDKSELRRRLSIAGISPVRYAVAADVAEAARAAGAIGYPVVMKPRGLSGSIGVVRAGDEAALTARFETVLGARVGLSSSPYAGVLIEEYLDGPEFSVDAVTRNGRTVPVVVAEKLLGDPPYFEEIGHVVPAPPRPGLDEALEMVARAHAAAGLDDVVTHTEFRLTGAGPRIIELNARLGGDLIPYLGSLALGIDVAAAVADVAIGQAPELTPTRSEVAAVRMIYPDRDLTVRSVALDPAAAVAGLDRFEVLARPGEQLRLPPGGFLSRLAVAVVRGRDHAECERALAEVEVAVVVEGEPL